MRDAKQIMMESAIEVAVKLESENARLRELIQKRECEVVDLRRELGTLRHKIGSALSDRDNRDPGQGNAVPCDQTGPVQQPPPREWAKQSAEILQSPRLSGEPLPMGYHAFKESGVGNSREAYCRYFGITHGAAERNGLFDS